ncbi:hypothetical protein GALMADRAFT_836943 [Galerina marginata CBS 339.88]|uniref:Uncharacterized protein n=1 Tax=Galerina marginata (strain CBS 339.88) TaxID=685588 RepID=A0A067THM1_GALM3|nr:hypothetical protein GALMADRAFT_836943 [Galerina marginata CBS 339.88]
MPATEHATMPKPIPSPRDEPPTPRRQAQEPLRPLQPTSFHVAVEPAKPKEKISESESKPPAEPKKSAVPSSPPADAEPEEVISVFLKRRLLKIVNEAFQAYYSGLEC